MSEYPSTTITATFTPQVHEENGVYYPQVECHVFGRVDTLRSTEGYKDQASALYMAHNYAANEGRRWEHIVRRAMESSLINRANLETRYNIGNDYV